MEGRGLSEPPACRSCCKQRISTRIWPRRRLELSGLALDLAGGHLSGSLTGKEILDAPALTGPLKLDQVSLRQWAPKLGVSLPATTDPKVFEKLSFSGTVSMTKTTAGSG